MADALWVAVGRVDVVGPLDEAVELGLQNLELADRPADLGRPVPEEAEDVAARCLTALAEGDDPRISPRESPSARAERMKPNRSRTASR